jgi:leader peptidase (prepilin peptidase)/N-methyltransferase
MAMNAEFWLLLLLSPAIGSFLGVLVRRLPQGMPVAMARSACEDCCRKLGVHELLPVLSYIIQRGRCRACGKAISRFHLYIELAACLVPLSAALAGSEFLVADCLLGWLLLALAWTDWESYLLPDVLTLPLLMLGLAEAWVLDPVLLPESLPDRLVGLLLGWGCLFAIGAVWRRWRGIEALGEGDAKLLAAGGAWLGWQALPDVLLIAALAGIAATVLRHRGRISGETVLAFGPWLALGIWIMRLLHFDSW